MLSFQTELACFRTGLTRALYALSLIFLFSILMFRLRKPRILFVLFVRIIDVRASRVVACDSDA